MIKGARAEPTSGSVLAEQYYSVDIIAAMQVRLDLELISHEPIENDWRFFFACCACFDKPQHVELPYPGTMISRCRRIYQMWRATNPFQTYFRE